jgi:sterol desaturase/sphingolipid hydroxylase (fatty acid hydroxylase superfamily)
MINNFRNTPFNAPVRLAIESFPGAVFGVAPWVTLIYSALTGVIVLWQHSDCEWNRPWLERHLLIGARAHRVHHSKAELHLNKNMGILVFWAKLFGTYFEVDSMAGIEIGIDDPNHNRKGVVTEMVLTWRNGFKKMLQELILLGPRVPWRTNHDSLVRKSL